MIGKPGIGKQPPERFETDESFADMLVPIDSTAARLLRVVAMEDVEPIEADDALERLERVVVAGRVSDVVSGCEQVAGIEADADPGRAIEMRQDRGQMLESMPDGASLPCGVLEQDLDLLARARP